MKQSFLNLAILLTALGCLLLSLSLGFQKAHRTQITRVILANTDSLRTGLQFFYNDFERYPKVSEFASPVDMLPYFSAFPPKNYRMGKCEKTWVYERPNPETFVLNFCLLEDYGNYSVGWQKTISN